MAEAKSTTDDAAGNTAVPQHGDHDRVAMLSLRADGTPDQHNPELIGDREFARDATREQFRQQAVSAADVAERGVVADTGAVEAGQDPAIERLRKVHEAAAKAAEKAADKAVDALHTGETEAAPATSENTAPRSGTSRAKSGS